jgi:hypothetical protein
MYDNSEYVTSSPRFSHYDFNIVPQDDIKMKVKYSNMKKIIHASQDDHVKKIYILYCSYYFILKIF